jgi:triple functional domain protein
MTDHHHHSIMPTTTASSSSTQSQSARFVTDIITPLKDRVALLPGSRDRQKHPIIFFPTTDISANSDELKNILFYFYSVTADDAKPHGFIFIIGSKKGASRQTVKPSSILHLINEYFPGKVIAVYIIVKGNNFFKTSSTSGKYKFHVQEITDEKTLTKFIDSSQLLKEFGGNLHYDHDEWIEIRKDIEFVIQKLSGCLKECEICYKLLQKKKFIEDNGQDWPLNSQDEFDRRLNSISTIDCDNDIRRIHQQILNTADDRYNSNTVKTPNPDLAFVIPFLQKLAKNIAKERADLTGNYQRSKLEQDQWNQFRLLENEVIELKNRIINQKVTIDETFTVIGNNESDAQQLLKEHQRFEDSVEQTKVNYTHLLKHGSILINNFPAKKSEIDAILKDLENSWNYLTALIDQRLKLLDIVISFRQQTEIYFSKLPEWMNFIKAQPDNLNRPLTELEDIAKGQEEVENDIELSYI